MAHINPSLPNNGDPNWGTPLIAAIGTLVSQVNTHDDSITSFAATSGPTRSAAYSFGGADAILSGFGAGNNYAVRQGFSLPQTWGRIRFRFRNYLGWNDGGTAMGNATIGNVYLGKETIGTPITFSAAPELVSAGGAGLGGTISGLTEFVTGWFTPVDTTTQDARRPLLLSYQLQNNTGSAISVAQSNGGRVWANATGAQVAQLAATGYNDNGAGIFTEIIAEYETTATTPIGLFIGPSFIDAHSATGTAGWLGQESGFAQLWSKRTGGIAVVNGYGNTQATDWGSASQKWSRFPLVIPNFIFVSCIGNDIISGGITLATAQSRYATLLATIHAKYPNVPVFSQIEPPYGITGTQETVRTSFNAWLPTAKKALGISGIVDLDRAVRDTTTASNVHADFISADNLHPNPRGYEKLTDVFAGIVPN